MAEEFQDNSESMDNVWKYEKDLRSKYQADIFDFVRNCSIDKLLKNFNEVS